MPLIKEVEKLLLFDSSLGHIGRMAAEAISTSPESQSATESEWAFPFRNTVPFQGTQTHSGICGFVCMSRWYGVNPITSHGLLIIVFLLAFQYSCPPDYFFP